MKLEHILKSMEIVSILGPKDVEIKGLEYDSRNVKKDELFVCINGTNVDGHNFIECAKQKGAVAFLIDKSVEKDDGFTYIKVKNTNDVLSILSKNFYENPSEQLNLIVF